jgi:hypothetical protein
MCGFGELKEELEPGPRILFYSNDNEWVVAKEPLNRLFFPSGNPQMVLDYIRLPAEGSGPGLLFAKRVLQATNRSIGLIGIGSGLVITRIWDSAKGSEPPPPHIYDQMIQRVIEAGGYGKLKGMVWYQGEHVAVINPSASKVYEHNLLSFIDRVRRDTGNPELPIIVVHLCRYVTSTVPGMPGVSGGGETYSDLYATYAQAWEHVREAQRHAAQKRGNVYVVASLDCDPMVDPIHLNFGAFQRLGRRLAEAALSEVYKLPGHGTPIQLESVQAEPMRSYKTNAVVHGHAVTRVRFSAVTGRLRGRTAFGLFPALPGSRGGHS